MQVREWDPETAPASDLEAWRALINEVFACDLPEEPEWRSPHLREYLAVNMPEEHRMMWFAESGSEVLGSVSILLVGADTAVLSLFVRPDARRGGVGRALLAAAAWRAHSERRRTLMAEVMVDNAVKFYEAYGFRRTMAEVRHLLNLADVDWLRTEQLAGRLATGYRIEYLPGGPPDEMTQEYARAKQDLRGPGTDLGTNLTIEANRLRASLATLRHRGLRTHVVVAVHEPTGQIAGLTEVVVPTHRPERADQYDTLVVPTHRGYGLGLAIKARLLLALHEAEPQLHDVQTWQSLEMEQMARVNAVLGFAPDREWYEYEAEIPDLLARLSP
ncbi:MAG TPA: GNAT family N-acetyltransferase [Micromonosporaceae bacterium]